MLNWVQTSNNPTWVLLTGIFNQVEVCYITYVEGKNLASHMGENTTVLDMRVTFLKKELNNYECYYLTIEEAKKSAEKLFLLWVEQAGLKVK
jgi:hypothetical protein